MLDCKEFEDKIELYIDKELSTDEIKEFEMHLNTCPSCRENLEFAIALRKTLREIELPSPPKDFLDRVNNAIDAQIISAPKNKSVKRFLNWRTYQAVAACLLIAAFLGLNTDRLTNNLETTTDLTVGNKENVVSSGEFINPMEIETADKDGVTEENSDRQEKNNADNYSVETKSTKRPIIDDTFEGTAPNRNSNEETVISGNGSSGESVINEQEKENTDEQPQNPLKSAVIPETEQKEEQKNNEETNDGISVASYMMGTQPRIMEDKSADVGVQSTNEESINAAAADSDVKSTPDSQVGYGGGSGGSAAGGILKKNSDGKISVPTERLSEAKNIAMHYGSCENGIFGMTGDKYNEFLTALESAGIEYTASVYTSGAVRFEITAE